MTSQKIGRYEIKSELGRGGMATVYKAYDPRFEREVALKVLPREMLHDPQFRLRFEREAKTIASLEHPAIVPVYDVGEEDGQPYFVMRLMPGGSLQELIAKGVLSLSYAARLLERLAPALDSSHEKGIIHRDLKPGNILFDRAGDPYISDYGIAKITQAQGTTVTGGAIIGTPAYMSPEQAQGETVDGRSDIYALGVILYEMLSGAQPYQATTPMAIVVKHITDPVPHILDANPALPTGIEAVIEKAMAKNREDRFATATEFAEALSAIARGEPAEQAITTASLNATKIAAARTRALAGKTKVQAKESPTLQTPQKSGFPLVAVLLVAVLLLGVAGAGILFATGVISFAQPTQIVVVLPEETATSPAPTSTPLPASPTDLPPTEVPPSPTAEPATLAAPLRPAIGGADQIALIANKEVWLVNMDGSNLTQLTSDGQPKTDLQWIPGTRTLVFISGTNINTIEADTKVFDTIASFPAARYLDTFRISPDASQVAISLNREMYLVPFDVEALRRVRGRDGLIALKGCLAYEGRTQTAVYLEEFRWSEDLKTAALLFDGVDAAGKPADLVRILDISSCDPKKVTKLDEFPGTRFPIEGYINDSNLPDFDWDGTNLFLLNTSDRNNGWGFLYLYSAEIRQGSQKNPIASTKSRCCYRDARWSPDLTHFIVAFQSKDTLGSPTQVYYIPISAIDTGVAFQPIPFPEGFFKDPKEAPQFALYPAP